MITTFTTEQFIRLAPRGLVVRYNDRILYHSSTLPSDTTPDELVDYPRPHLSSYMTSEEAHHYIVHYDYDTPSTMYDSWDIFQTGREVEVVTLPALTIYGRRS